MYQVWIWLFILAAASSIMNLDSISTWLWNAWFCVIAVQLLIIAASLL